MEREVVQFHKSKSLKVSVYVCVCVYIHLCLGHDDVRAQQDVARDEGIESFRKEEITSNVKCNRGPLTNKY